MFMPIQLKEKTRSHSRIPLSNSHESGTRLGLFI